jgi:hypothetical protein
MPLPPASGPNTARAFEFQVEGCDGETGGWETGGVIYSMQ